MFQVDIDGKKVNAEVSFYTAQLYEAEFCRDIIQDFFGVVDLSDGSDGAQELNIDFTKINWLATTRVLWAAIKTADPNAPGYQEWTKGNSGVNMFSIREQLVNEVADCFFRAETAEAKPEGKRQR